MEYRLRHLAAILLMLLGVNGQLAAAPIVLYDDSQGNLPADQPWLFYADDSVFTMGIATQTAVAAGVFLETDNVVSAGYSNYILPLPNAFKNPTFPVLDRIAGFRLQFELQVNAELHSNNDRAGFSVILLASDLLGIELGFWTDEIWAQSDSPLFTHAEGVTPFDTTAREVTYDLTIMGLSYSLAANGTTILSNALRDYSAFGLPYSLPSYLFLGDDTSSAAADITLGQVTLDIEIPLPSSLLLLLAGLLALISVGRRRCRRSPARIPLLRPRNP